MADSVCSGFLRGRTCFDVCGCSSQPERRAPPVPAGCFIQCCCFFFLCLEAARFYFLLFNLESAQMCSREVTRQEVGAMECGCVGEVSLVEVEDKRF